MAHDADPRGDTYLAGVVEDVAGAPLSALPVKGIAVKEFVPVHLTGSAGASVKPIGAQNSLAKVKKACYFEHNVPDVLGVGAVLRSSSPELRRSPREDNDRSSSVHTRYMQFTSDGSLLTESSAFREQRSLQRLAAHSPCGPGRTVLRRTKLRAQRSAMSELWKKPRRQRSLLGGAGVDAHARSEPPPHCTLLPEGDDELASANDAMFGARRSRFLREDIQPCTSFVGISSSTVDHYCCRDRASSSCLPGGTASLRRLEGPPASSESRVRCQLDRLRPSACRQQKRRRVRVSSSSRTDDYEDDLLLARLEDHAACAKLTLSELRCPAGKLRTSDMFVGGGRRCRSTDVVEVARNVVIWVLVLSGTATIMFGAVGIIVLRTGSVMFLSSAVGSALTTVGVLMAIYCTDASSDRGLQRMINHKYNYT
ncbi:uncharacterized protein [Dermacentor albipictus]|uniref:uncharacterized protein n=1 Tax=Dermacentor albipictus TaxID=60249 RepID=UPI0038FBF914